MENSTSNLKEFYPHILRAQANGQDSIVSFGIPLPRGKLFDHERLIVTQEEIDLPLHAKVTGKWPDSSIRWLNFKAIVGVDKPIEVKMASSAPTHNSKKVSSEQAPLIRGIRNINGSKESFSAYPLLQISPFTTALSSTQVLEIGISLSLKLEKVYKLVPVNLQFGELEVDSLSQTLPVNGEFRQGKHRLKFNIHLSFCHQTREIDLEVRLHNPRASKHCGGCWDLGDLQSAIIEKFSIAFKLGNANHSLTVYEDYQGEDASLSKLEPSPTQLQAPFTLKQLSSGGFYWQSPIHWNEHKQCTAKEPGFELSTLTDSDKKKDPKIGRRARPYAQLQSQGNFLYIQLKDFWQNFPVTINSDGKHLTYDLFSTQTELQGGESKTWRFKARAYNSDSQQETLTSANIHSVFQPVSIRYSPEYFNDCQVFPHLAFSETPMTLTPLISQGLAGDQNFFSKREKTDAFGWRHYGELYADHETHGLTEEEKACFISHYNNQYDPLMGMILQYLHHGDSNWLKLIHPLSYHIQDIDIYDTGEDKAEYNGGLFWHTDHYLTAETCSHRSKSRYHTAPYEGFQGGGGPGGQHCYTTGLAMQYRLFGDENAKQKVAQLCNWIRNFYNGDGSILDRTFRLLTFDLKQNTLTNYGFKAPGFKYPLDRGTGNYLTALMDHHDLNEAPELLKEIGYVIRNTCHPKEDISLRTLDNIESCWFYTVFLQAVARFLFLKESLNSIDEDYWYARHTLLHFGNWMYEHESFYLDTPEKLEFPNDTWCAQELRKANLFYFLSYFSEDNSKEFFEKGRAYYDYVSNRLHTSQESQYTRILALMMQNDGVQQKFSERAKSQIPYEERDYGKPPKFSRKNIFLGYLKDIFKSILHFSIAREWRWLKLKILK